MMESDFMLCVYFTFLLTMSGLFFYVLLRNPVTQIPAADEEDRALGLYCEPETLWQISADVDQVNMAKPIDHYHRADWLPTDGRRRKAF